MSHQQIILSEIAFIQFPRDFNTSSYKDGTKRWQTTWNILKTLEVPCDKEFCLHPSRLTARVGFYDREFAFLPIYLKQNLARSSTQDDREMRMGFKLRFNECHRSLVWCFAWVCFSSFKCFSAPSHVRINRCKNKFSSELLFWQWHRIIIGRTHVDDSVLHRWCTNVPFSPLQMRQKTNYFSLLFLQLRESETLKDKNSIARSPLTPILHQLPSPPI